MTNFYSRKGNRFRKLDPEEAKLPELKPWLGIEFDEMGGLSVKKLYVTNGEQTYEIIKAPPLGGGPYEYQILVEITSREHPFLSTLIKDEFEKL